MSPPVPAPGAVLFDMDGVLVDSSSAHVQAWARFLEDQGLPPPREGIRSLFGRRASEAVATLLGTDADPDATRSALQLLERYADALLDEYAPGELLIAGVEQLVGHLADAGWRLAVATSARRRAAEHSLGELLTRFDAVVTAEDVARGKPDPEVYLTAARRLAILPTSCIVVEDAVAGVEAGKRAGMHVVAVTGTAGPQRLREAGADVVVDHVAEVLPLLEGGDTEPNNRGSRCDAQPGGPDVRR